MGKMMVFWRNGFGQGNGICGVEGLWDREKQPWVCVLNVKDFNSMEEGGRQEEKHVLILATHGFLLDNYLSTG